METLNTIEKITLLLSTGIVCLANLFVMLEGAKKREKQNSNNAIQKWMTINLKANNKTTKVTLSIALVLSSFLIRAQDTIYFKNKTIVAAKITEVGISEIKYQRLDNLTGPNYLSAKNEISLIKYSNGVIDSIRSVMPVVDPISVNMTFHKNRNEIRISGNKMVYQNRTIGDNQLRRVIADLPSSETQIRLKKEFKTLKDYKLKECALAPALFLGGAGIHLMALGNVFSSNGGAGARGGTALVSAFVVGAILRISGHVINTVYKNKARSKREDIADIYNGIQ